MLAATSPVGEPASPSSTNPFETASPDIQRNTNNTTSANLVTVDDDGFKLLSRDAIMRMLSIHAEAIVRCVELTDSQEL